MQLVSRCWLVASFVCFSSRRVALALSSHSAHNTYTTLASPHEKTLEVLKSKFVARAKPASDIAAALVAVEASRKSDVKASHHCWAYLSKKSGGRCSDDGEPSGTAGRPMLSVLEGEAVYDTVVVIARYFGGTKLGTGGLVRAYSQATRDVLSDAKKLIVIPTLRVRISLPLQDSTKVYAVMSKLSSQVPSPAPLKISEHFGEEAFETIWELPAVENGGVEQVRSLLTDATKGQAKVEILQDEDS